jgi:hypothetical protein
VTTSIRQQVWFSNTMSAVWNVTIASTSRAFHAAL